MMRRKYFCVNLGLDSEEVMFNRRQGEPLFKINRFEKKHEEIQHEVLYTLLVILFFIEGLI